MRRPRPRRWILPTIAGVVILALVVAIDDPLRDFTTNFAEITEDASDPALRPQTFERPASEVIEAIRLAAGRIRGWRFVGEASAEETTSILLFERTSRVWRFKDDVTLRVEDLGRRCAVTGTSRSRVGLGDLGQNPRNLRRILSELRLVLDSGSGR